MLYHRGLYWANFYNTRESKERIFTIYNMKNYNIWIKMSIYHRAANDWNEFILKNNGLESEKHFPQS